MESPDFRRGIPEGDRLPFFGAASFGRFRSAERNRPERRLEPHWPEIFHFAFARLGLGLGWAVGVAQVFGAGERAALAGSLASLCLLLLATLAVAVPLPAPKRFLLLGANFDSPAAWRMVAVWGVSALFLVNTFLLLAFPSAHRFFLALLGLEMLILCPAALAVSSLAHGMEPRPHWKSPFLPLLYMTSGLAVGTLLFAGYGFALTGAAGPFRAHLVLAVLLLAGQLFAGIRHLKVLRHPAGAAAGRLHGPPGRDLLITYAAFAFALPVQLAFFALFLDGPWLWIFAPAPILASASIFLERILFYRLENRRA